MDQLQQIDWNRFLDLAYWLEGIAGSTASLSPIETGSFFFWFFLYLFSTLLIAGVSLRVSQAFLHQNHPLQKHLPFWGNNLIWMGIAGMAWFLMRQLNVSILGARFLFPFGAIWFLAIAYLAVNYFWKFYPMEILHFRNKIKSKA